MGEVFTAPIPVRFAETDLMGIVHHSAYVVWFEMGRIAWMGEVGVPYTEVSQLGFHFAVTGVQASYRASATFGDVVVVGTEPTLLRSRQICFSYNIYNASSKTLLVTGSSEHVCVDVQRRTAKIPHLVLERFRRGVEKLQSR